MKTTQAERLFDLKMTLGEGPLWHPDEHCLYWVDIDSGALYQSDRTLKAYTCYQIDTSLGAFGFCKNDQLILATGRGFAAWSPGKDSPDYFWNPLPGRDGVRLNDGKVDPAGRFWAGSIDTAQQQGELYRLDPDGTQQTLLKRIGISNGLGWSPDGTKMYYTDSYYAVIHSFDFNIETGQISNQRPFVTLPRDHDKIVPDGLCVDVEGCVWSAQWNGWQVIRYDPEGNPILSVKVPASRVTSCCFGGENLDLLLITTARTGLSEKELAEQPHAGSVFVCQTKTTGLPENYYG